MMSNNKKVCSLKSIPSFTWSTKLGGISTPSMEKKKRYKQVNQYLILCKLGEGSYSKVFLGQDQRTLEYYALKRINLKPLSKTPSGMDQLHFEIEIMKKLNHSNIVSLHEVIYDTPKKYVYIVIEYANCGNLSSIIESDFNLSPEHIQNIFAQLVTGVSYLHQNSIVHQDLKPANILMNSDGKVLISDFGIGHTFQYEAFVVGTPAYQAPEVIDDSHVSTNNSKANPAEEDVWSLGVTLYELVFKNLPFYGNNVFEIVHAISKESLAEPPSPCDPILWDLIKKMLIVDPQKRITIPEIMNHPYFLNASIDNNPMVGYKVFVPPSIEANPIIENRRNSV